LVKSVYETSPFSQSRGIVHARVNRAKLIASRGIFVFWCLRLGSTFASLDQLRFLSFRL
jgi:hypothetical protein